MMTGSMVFNLDRLEKSTQNQFDPWKTRIYALTPRNSILTVNA